MTAPLQAYAMAFFIVFCRVGAALMLLPAFSNTRFPVQVRIIFALVLSFAFLPFLWPRLSMLAPDMPVANFVAIIAVEIFVGTLFGFWGFLFLHASRFAGTFIATAVGLAGIPGQPVDEQEATSHLASLLSLAATALVFASGLHLVSLQALLASYNNLPVGEMPSSLWAARGTVQLLSQTFVLALQISSPFVVLVVISNFAIGLANRFTPQLSVFFAVTGLTTMASLALLAAISPQLLSISVSAYADWLQNGLQ